RPLDSRADIYALGISLYEMVTGQRPYRGQNLTDLSQAILAGAAPPASQIELSVPLPLDAIIGHALARDPEQRYATAGAMRDDLRALQAQMGPALTTTPTIAGSGAAAAVAAPTANAGSAESATNGLGPFRRNTLRPLDEADRQELPATVRTYPPRRPR
ncbi:MAG: hypothetical protein ACHQ4H_01415, partial [Ktedonobacterales bacterium]